MGRRGPHLVDREQLKFAARRWAAFLFALRDGARGMVEKWDKALIIEIVQPKARGKTERILRDLESKGYEIGWPIYPAAKIWERLKRTATPVEVRKTIAALRAWRKREQYTVVSEGTLRTLQADPLVLLRAKRLPNYPKDKKTSDDKRIVFVAKILAAVEAGLAPLTVTKKLSRWRCENYWKNVSTAYVESFKSIRQEKLR